METAVGAGARDTKEGDVVDDTRPVSSSTLNKEERAVMSKLVQNCHHCDLSTTWILKLERKSTRPA